MRSQLFTGTCVSAAACAATLLLPATAVAQTASDQGKAAPSWAGDQIIVTGKRDTYAAPTSTSATRTDTPLIQVPQSVQVVTGALLKEQDRRTLGDALVNVSGVTPTRSDETLFIPPILRGFPGEVYLDGLPIFAGNQQAFDPNSLVGVAAISVLKGPSATLYGGGLGTPLGGIINVETARPADKTGGTLALRAGSFSTWNPYGDLNFALSPAVSAKIAGEYQSNGSWIDKVKGKRWSVQPSILFKLTPDTDLLVQGQFNHRGALEYSGLPADAALAGTIARNAFPGSPIGQPQTDNDNRMGTVTLRHAFSPRVKLTISGRYYANEVNESGSFVFPDLMPTGTLAPNYDVYPITMITSTKEATFDANLGAKFDVLGGTHNLLGGINYDWTSFYSAMGLFVSNSPSGTIDLSKPFYNLTYTAQTPVNSYEMDHYQTFAAYVQDQATYGPLHLTGGLRLTSLRFVEDSNYGVANNKTYTHVSPRVGATLDVAQGVALFAGWATAFRAPFAYISLQPSKPEGSSNVEAGVKLALPKAGLSGTLALFSQTHDNVATADPNNVGFYIQSGRQRARGVEVDLVWEPSPALSLLANYAYTDTRDNGVAPGDRLARVPESSGRIAARYRILHGVAKGLAFGAGITAVTSRQLTLPNSIAVPGYAVIDAQGSYDIGRFTLGVSVVNLGGRRAWDPYSYMGYPVVGPNQPRSAYVTLKARI